MRTTLVVALALCGCPDQSLQVVNTAPEVSFVAPAPGTSFAVGAEVVFEANVRDAQSLLADLELVWSTDRAATLVGAEERFEDRVTLTVAGGTFPDGDHRITLTALDPLGASGEDSLDITIAENADPIATFEAPAPASTWPDDEPVPVRLRVVDPDEDRLPDLTVVWTGLPPDAALPEHPDTTGLIAVDISVPVGSYTASAEVFDTYGGRSVASVSFEVFDHRDDADDDGFRDEAVGGDDCDDDDPDIHPGADEHCDGVDEDCDGPVDEDPVDAPTWYPDDDDDGWGAPVTGTVACDAPGELWADNRDDCNDDDPDVNPGAAEIPYNGVDDDCVDGDECDVDDDGWDAEACGGADCLDDDPEVNPNRAEVPYNGLDDDCVGGDLCDVDGDGFAATLGACGGDDCDDDDDSRWSRGPIEVPTQAPTIQDAIDALCDDGRVDVLPGTYVEVVDLGTRNIEIVGEDRDTVIVDGGGAGPVFTAIRGTLRDLTIRGGSAPRGGGVFLHQPGAVRLESLRVEDNTAQELGGGVYIEDATAPVVLDDVIVSGNATTGTATTTAGGGIAIFDSPVTLRAVTLHENATNGLGGGLRIVSPAARVTLQGVVATGNTARERGGVSVTNAQITDLTIQGNASTSAYGAGALEDCDADGLIVRDNHTAATFDATLLLLRTDARDLLAVGNSGGRSAVILRGPDAELAWGRLLDNDAPEAMAIWEGATVDGLIVAGNRGAGLAIANGSGDQHIGHATIAGNDGVGLRIGTSSSATFVDGIITDNATGASRVVGTAHPAWTAVYGNGTDWAFPPPANANNTDVDCHIVDMSPLDPEAWDLHLAPDSPCRTRASDGGELGAYGSAAAP